MASKIVPILTEALKGVSGLAGDVLADDAKYDQYVITPMWLLMPLPVRLLGRKRVRWDEFFLLLRREAFVVREGRVVLRDDLAQCMAKIVASMFSSGEKAPLPPVQQAPPPPGLPPQYQAPTPLPAPPPVVIVAAPPPPPPPPPGPPIAVGIDLGTTYSVVAHLDNQGRPWSIQNAAGDILTPSVVLFEEDGGVVVGREAVRAASVEPELVADLVKRDMGAKWYHKKINGEAVPPEVISAAILSSLKADAERKLGPVAKAVITVPAYFDEPRRRATMDAGRMAGLDVLDILNEPTAAAICYGYQLGFLNRYGAHTGPGPLRVLVYDLGGGTFDVTIVEIRGASFRALATDGDVRLGGKDWDQHLIDIAAEQFRKQHREEPRTHPASLAELSVAEEAKRTLTERPKATMYVNHLGLRAKVEVTRQEFEAATAPLLARTRMTCEIVVRQAGLTWADIDRVILVGGSSRMPQVARMLEEVSGKKPDLSLSLDEAVAHGAALYADLLVQSGQAGGGAARFSVSNVSSHALGMVSVDPKTGAEKNTILLPKNAPLPASVTKLFKTYKPGQRVVKLRVLEGDAERPEECTPVGVCLVRNLPPGVPAGTPVRVTYTYDTNGRLRVAAAVEGVADVVTEFSRDTAVTEADMGMWTAFVSSASQPV